jgi:hypothetical protein
MCLGLGKSSITYSESGYLSHLWRGLEHISCMQDRTRFFCRALGETRPASPGPSASMSVTSFLQPRGNDDQVTAMNWQVWVLCGLSNRLHLYQARPPAHTCHPIHMSFPRPHPRLPPRPCQQYSPLSSLRPQGHRIMTRIRPPLSPLVMRGTRGAGTISSRDQEPVLFQ